MAKTFKQSCLVRLESSRNCFGALSIQRPGFENVPGALSSKHRKQVHRKSRIPYANIVLGNRRDCVSNVTLINTTAIFGHVTFIYLNLIR